MIENWDQKHVVVQSFIMICRDSLIDIYFLRLSNKIKIKVPFLSICCIFHIEWVISFEGTLDSGFSFNDIENNGSTEMHI